jgi:hypothetical protein
LRELTGICISLALLASPVLAQGPRSKSGATVKSKTKTKTRTQPASQTPKSETPPGPSPKELAEAAAESRTKLMDASKTYQESLERLLELQQKDEARAQEVVAKRKGLLELGVIAKRELEEGETALAETKKKVTETHQRLNEVEQLVAEVLASEQLANQPVIEEPVNIPRQKVLLVRYTGRTNWMLTNDYAKVDAFFRAQYGRPLPVSAFGQTETHNRLNFDHSNALDVAVHPDSAEGQALQGFLRASGISFIAIRGAIAGSATGAHIHIGAPSKRLIL